MALSEMAENHQAALIGPGPRSVQYLVRFPAPRSHYACIEAVFPAGGDVELFLPVWTPGSYMVREYSRHLEGLSARDDTGRELRVEKTRKNRWRVRAGEARQITVSYRVYCREMSVRTNWVEESFALLNGAPTFVGIAGRGDLRCEVRLELPREWKASFCGLERSSTNPNCYVASDYDALIDSPIYAGNPAAYEFTVGGVPHVLVNEGEAGVWDGPRSAADLEKIVRRTIEFWGGSVPYKKYVFLNLLTEAGGGLEHRNSFCVMASRWAMKTRPAYLHWLNLVSHEYFHTWNVKRLRPVELGPFDYEIENTTRGLWVAEGITEYYGGLMLRRAGLSSDAEYLGIAKEPARDSLSDLIHTLQTTPGRLAHSIAEASFDAWIKLYRPDENSKNTSISYYVKGAVIAWLLDVRIRRQTSDAKSLDDAMRVAFARFSGDRGFREEEFEAIASEVAGIDLKSFFDQAIRSTAELDYSEALDWFGLQFKGAAEDNKHERRSWLGVDTRVDGGRLVITRIPRGGPADNSGLMVDDEIIALDDFRVRPEKFEKHLENHAPGERVSVLVARRDKLARYEVTLAEPPRKWRLELSPRATTIQKKHLEDWLAGGNRPDS
jgi:predicted metalloprotease with PDZ domain